MAIYRIQANAISRRSKNTAKGAPERSVVACAAYRSGTALYDERAHRTRDFRRKGCVAGSEIVAPDQTPDWLKDRFQLWNAVEAVERRKDSCLARELELSLPRELPPSERVALVRGFVQDILTARGFIADVSYHNPVSRRDGRENPHAHVLYTTRTVTPEGFGPKDRAFETGRIALFHEWRQRWEDKVNAALAQAHSAARVDRRSLKDQGIDRLPEPKIGPQAWAMEHKGIPTERAAQWREVIHTNGLMLDAPLPLAELTLSGVAPWTPEQVLARLFQLPQEV
jgi:ATP-dependent exoDNAse (exonuclease V) alpha subunit